MPLVPVLIVSIGMPWEFMGFNYFLNKMTHHLVSETPPKQDIDGKQGPKTLNLAEYTTSNH